MPLTLHAITAGLILDARASASLTLLHTLLDAPPVQESLLLALQILTTPLPQSAMRTGGATLLRTRACKKQKHKRRGADDTTAHHRCPGRLGKEDDSSTS